MHVLRLVIAVAAAVANGVVADGGIHGMYGGYLVSC